MENAKINIIRFDDTDVITTSGCPMSGFSTLACPIEELSSGSCSYVVKINSTTKLTETDIDILYDASGNILCNNIDTDTNNDLTDLGNYDGNYFHYSSPHIVTVGNNSATLYSIQLCNDSSHH